MTLRRTLLLCALVLVGVVLAVVVRPPARPTGLEAVRGHRVFKGAGPVEGIDVTWEGHTFSARRDGSGWRIDGAPADAGTVAALDDLVQTLVRLRALDTFRAEADGGYGLAEPRGTIALHRGGRVRRLAVGGINTAGSAFYARDEADRRMFQVGVGIESSLERVLYSRDRQRPEIG